MSLDLLLAAALLLGAPASAAPKVPPGANEILWGSLEGPSSGYEGRVLVTVFASGKGTSREMLVRYLPPSRYRREILGAKGSAAQVVVSDGKTERIYDRARNRVWEGEPADPYFKRLGPDEEFALLSSNYEVSIGTASPVAGRPAWRLDLRSRADGSLRRSLWVDRERGLVLRSLERSPDGSPVSETRFLKVSFPARQDEGLFAFDPPAGAKVSKRLEPDYMAVEEAKEAGVEPRLPAWLPSGYVFESLDLLPKGKKKVVHYRFSDGVNALSLFQCPPRSRLALGPKGGEKVRVGAGKGVLAWAPEGAILSWSSGKTRFFLVGRLPAESLRRVAESVR